MAKNNLKKDQREITGSVGKQIMKTAQRQNLRQLIIILSAFAILISFVITFVIVFNQNKKSVIASQLETPSNVRVEETINESGSQYFLRFDAVKHADYYAIYLFDGEEAVDIAIEENFLHAIPYITTTRTTIDVTDSIDEIGDYYFSVQAVYRKVESYSSLLSDPKGENSIVVKTYTLQTPKVIVQTARQGISVGWRSVLNASKYNVKYELDIRYAETEESVLDEPQIVVGNVYNIPQNILDRMNAYEKNEFIVKVKAFSDNKFVIAGDWGQDFAYTYKKAGTPQIKNDYDFIGGVYTFNWDKTTYTEGYYVFVNNKLVKTITDCDETSYSFTPADYGAYSAKVQSYNTNQYVDDSEMSDEMPLPDNRAVTAPVARLYAERVNETIRVSWTLDPEKTYYYVYVQSEIEEPFVDENNNDLYDLGEEFTDKNNNGVYDGGYITKPGSTELYYEKVDSFNEVRFNLDLNPTGYYKISVKAARQSEYFDPSLGFKRVIIRFDETKGTKLAKPSLEYDDLTNDIVYGAKSQEVKDEEDIDGIRVLYMAPRATDNNGFEINVYAGENNEGTLLSSQTIAKLSLELSSYRKSLTPLFDTYGAGKYFVTVKALGGYLLFTDSQYNSVQIDHTIKLGTPQNISMREVRDASTNELTDVTLSFSTVNNANKYSVFVNAGTDALININSSSNEITSGYAFVENNGVITVSNLYSQFFSSKNREPGTYSFAVKAGSDNASYSDGNMSDAVAYRLVKYVSTPILSHTSQIGSDGHPTNNYIVYWRYKDTSGNIMFDDDQTFDVFVNGRRFATELMYSKSSIITDGGVQYYSLDITAGALPGLNVVQIKANAKGNYLASTSIAKEFVDYEDPSTSTIVQQGYHYYVELGYDVNKNIKVSGSKDGTNISYSLKFTSEKYANRFRFWFDKTLMDTPSYDTYTYNKALEALALDANADVFASESNVYLNGYTNKETVLNIEERFIKFNATNFFYYDISFDIDQALKNNQITAERAAYIHGRTGQIRFADLFHLEPVKDFTYSTKTYILTFRYDNSLIDNVQSFIIYYKFGDAGVVKSIILGKDTCLSEYRNEAKEAGGDYYVFEYFFNPDQVGKLFIKVEPINANAILIRETDYLICNTSKKLEVPQNIEFSEDGVLSWDEVPNASVYTSTNKIYPYYVEIYTTDNGLYDGTVTFFRSFSWTPTSVNVFDKYPELKIKKDVIFAKVRANAYQFVQNDEAFSATVDYVGDYIDVSTTPGVHDFVLVTDTNKDDVGFIITNVTRSYYPQYYESEFATCYLDYTPTLKAPILSLEEDILTITKPESYITSIDYELYISGNDTPIYTKLHDGLDDSTEIALNIKSILVNECGATAGAYSLYAIAKQVEWGVQSENSESIVYNVTENLTAVSLIVRNGNVLESYTTHRSFHIKFTNVNDLENIKGFRINFKKPIGYTNDNSVKVLNYSVCAVKNVEEQAGEQIITFVGKIIMSGTNWENSVLPTNATIEIKYSVEYDTNDNPYTVFTVEYVSTGDIFTAQYYYPVSVTAIGEEFYNDAATQWQSIVCLDGQFATPELHVDSETSTYTQANPSTDHVTLFMNTQANVGTATIYMRNLLNKNAKEVVVEDEYRLTSHTVGGYYVYEITPYIANGLISGLFQEELGLYEMYVVYNGEGFIQASAKSNPVYIYYAYKGEGVESVMAEPNLSNLPLNLVITVNNSIYSNVDNSTFEKFYVELKPVVGNVLKNDDEASPTVLELTEGSDCYIDGKLRGALLTSKMENSNNTTTYNFAIPIKYISGFGASWQRLAWNYIIEVSVDYTLATNINDIVYNIDKVSVVDETKTTRLQLSKYAAARDRVIGKYYYDSSSSEYIIITSNNYNRATGDIIVNLALTNEETNEEITQYKIQDNEYIYDLKFKDVYASYDGVASNTYVGKYAYCQDIGGYGKIYSVIAISDGIKLNGLKLYGRRSLELAQVNVLDRNHVDLLPEDEYQFTLRSNKNADATLTTSLETAALRDATMSNGYVMWNAADTSTTFYYMYYVWDYGSNEAKIFYNDNGRENFYTLVLNGINSNINDGVFSYNFYESSIGTNNVCLNDSSIYCEFDFDEGVYDDLLDDSTRAYYYKTVISADPYTELLIRLTKHNVSAVTEGMSTTYVLQSEETGFQYSLTGAQIYEEVSFSEVASIINNSPDLPSEDFYVFVNNQLTKIESAFRYGDAVYSPTSASSIDLDTGFANITQVSSEWHDKWFSVQAQGVNGGKTMFNMRAYTDSTKNYVYGVLIYAVKSGCGASNLFNKNFVPSFAYNISNIQIAATKGATSVNYHLDFNDFDTDPFTSGLSQAVFNTNNRKSMFDVISVDGKGYSSMDINNGIITAVFPDDTIKNSYDKYAVRVQTKDLIFELSGVRHIVIPATRIDVQLAAPIIVTEDVAIDFNSSYIVSSGENEAGVVNYNLKFMAVDFATVYTVVVTENNVSGGEEPHYQGYKVVGTYNIRVNPSKMQEAQGAEDYYYYDYDLSEFMNSISEDFEAGHDYYVWVYVAADVEKGIDSLERASGGGAATAADGNYSWTRESFTAYTKARAVTDVEFNLNGADVEVNGVMESKKTLTFTTDETEYLNSVYKIVIAAKNKTKVQFSDDGTNYYPYAYYWTNNGASISFNVLRNFDNISYDSVNQKYTVTIDLTNEMTQVLSGDYTVTITIVPVQTSSNLIISDSVSKMAKNNRRLILNNLEYLKIIVDGYVSEILPNGEPVYYDEVLMNETIYNSLSSSNNQYYYRSGSEFTQIRQSDITVDGGVFYYIKEATPINLTGVYIYKLRNEAVNYLSGSGSAVRKNFNTKKIDVPEQFLITSSSWLTNWVGGLLTNTNETISAVVEVAFKKYQNVGGVESFEWNDIAGSTWNALYDLKSLGSDAINSYLTPGTYKIYARIKTSYDNGTYFKQVGAEPSIASEEILIYDMFNIYKRHMIDETVHNIDVMLNTSGYVIKDANGQFVDIYIPTGITEDDATYELYCYNNFTGELVFKTDPIAHNSSRKVSVLKYLMEHNDIITYGEYLFKIKWLASGNDLNNNILNSDLNETKGIVFEYYVPQTIQTTIESNKGLTRNYDLDGNGHYIIQTFDDYVYVTDYDLNIVLSTPQINATLVYSVIADESNEFVAHVKVDITGHTYVDDACTITYNYTLIEDSSNANFSIDGNILKFNLLPYIYGTEKIVGLHKFEVRIEKVKSHLTYAENKKEKYENSSVKQKLSGLYEDIYATNLDRIDDNSNAQNYVLNGDYQNLYIDNLRLNEDGILSWQYKDNSRLQLIDSLILILKNVDVITEGNGSKTVLVKNTTTINIDSPISGTNSYDLNTLLIADNSDEINYNEIELHVRLKEGISGWYVPAAFTNKDIDSPTENMKMDDTHFKWLPSMLNGSVVSEEIWTSTKSDPNIIKFDLEYNDFYSNDFRLIGENNTPTFTFEVLRLSNADYSADEYGLKKYVEGYDTTEGGNPVHVDGHQRDDNLIDVVKGMITELNNNMVGGQSIQFDDGQFSEADWQDVLSLFTLQTIGSGVNTKVDVDRNSYILSLRTLLYKVGANYVAMDAGEVGEIQLAINDGGDDYEYEAKYYVKNGEDYTLLGTKDAFTTANAGLRTIYRLENKWIQDVVKTVNDSAITPGQYFVRICLKDRTNSGYQDGVIYASTTYVLEQWEVVDLKFVSSDLSFEIRNNDNTGTTRTVQVTGKANSNLLFYTDDEDDIDDIPQTAKEKWANNEKPVYMTFRVKDTGITYKPHDSAVGFTLIHYYANSFIAGEPAWVEDYEQSLQVMVTNDSTSEYLGIDKEGYHVYVVNVANLINNNNENEGYGLHKYKVLVNFAANQAYAAPETTKGMSNKDAYINFMRVSTPEFEEFGFKKGGSGDSSGVALVKVSFKFTNHLGAVNKKLIVAMRAYPIPSEESDIALVPFNHDQEKHGLTLKGENDKIYKTTWGLDLADIDPNGPFAGLKKNTMFKYEAYVDANGVSPFLMNSEVAKISHMIVDGYEAPTSFAVVRSATDDYYQNFVNENDLWDVVKDETRFYNMNFKINDSDAGRRVVADREADMILGQHPWQYYGMTYVNESGNTVPLGEKANLYHYFIMKVVRSNQTTKGQHFEPYYYLVWYKVTEAATISGGQAQQTQESTAYIRRIELDKYYDDSVATTMIEYAESTFDDNQKYYYYEGGAYHECANAEAAAALNAAGRVLFVDDQEAKSKYKLTEYIRLETSQREAVNYIANWGAPDYAGYKYYENRYVLVFNETLNKYVYEQISKTKYQEYVNRHSVDANGKLPLSIDIYAKQAEIPHLTYHGVDQYGVEYYGKYTLEVSNGTAKQFVEFKNFGIELNVVVDGDNTNDLSYMKNSQTPIGFDAKLFNEISYYTTINSPATPSKSLYHFIEVDKANIDKIEFVGLSVSDEGKQYLTIDNQGNEKDFQVVIKLSNIKNASSIDLIYKIVRYDEIINTEQQMFNFVLPSRELETSTQNGAEIRWQKTNGKVKADETCLTITLSVDALKQMGILNSLPGEVYFSVHAVGYVENNNANNYNSDPDTAGVFTLIKAPVDDKDTRGINGLNTANYVNSQQIIAYNVINIYRKLNTITTGLSLKSAAQVGKNQSLFNDTEVSSNYLGTNLYRVKEGTFSEFNVITDVMLKLHKDFQAVGQQDDKTVVGRDVMVAVTFTHEDSDPIFNSKTEYTFATGISGVPLIKSDSLETNKNIYGFLEDSIPQDCLVTVTLRLYCAYGQEEKQYWFDGDEILYKFHYYRSIQINETFTVETLKYDEEREVQETRTNNNGIKQYSTGYLVPNDLQVGFQDANETQPTEGYKLDVLYVNKKNESAIIMSNSNLNNMQTISKDALRKSETDSKNKTINILAYLKEVGGNNAFKTGKEASALDSNSKLAWQTDSKIILTVTPYYSVGAYRIYGEPRTNNSIYVNLKLSHLRDISLEYFYENGFATNWLGLDNIASSKENAQALLGRARTQPIYGFYLENGAITNNTSAIGVAGARGLFVDGDKEYHSMSDYIHAENSLVYNKQTDTNHLSEKANSTNYDPIEYHFVLRVYGSKEATTPILTLYSNNDHYALTEDVTASILKLNQTRYSLTVANLVNCLNVMMRNQEGGIYYITYQLYDDDDDGATYLTSNESGKNEFIYRKVYSDYSDFNLEQAQADDGGKYGSYVNLYLQNTNAESKTSIIEDSSNPKRNDLFVTYNISTQLPITVANVWQKSVNNSSNLVCGNIEAKSLKNLEQVGTGLNAWSSPRTASSWEYNPSNGSNGIRAKYKIHSDYLDVLRFTADSSFVTENFAKELQKYGYISGIYGNQTWDNSGYLQVGQNLVQIQVDSNLFNLGYKFVFNYDETDSANGLKISLPEAYQPVIEKGGIVNGVYYYEYRVQTAVDFQEKVSYKRIRYNDSDGYTYTAENEDAVNGGADWDAARDYYYHHNDYDWMRATVYSTVLVRYGTYIEQVTYNVVRRNNFVASISEDRLSFTKGQNTTWQYGTKWGTNATGDNWNDTIVLNNDGSNDAKKELWNQNVTLTLNPKFGIWYSSYNVVSREGTNTITYNPSVDLSTYRYDQTNKRGNYVPNHGLVSINSVTNFTENNKKMVSGWYVYNQIDLTSYNVYYITSTCTLEGVFGSGSFRTWGVLYLDWVIRHQPNYNFGVEIEAEFESHWTANKAINLTGGHYHSRNHNHNENRNKIIINRDDDVSLRAVQEVIEADQPTFPCSGDKKAKERYDKNPNASKFKTQKKYWDNFPQLLSNCCCKWGSGSQVSSSTLSRGVKMSAKYNGRSKNEIPGNGKDLKEGTIGKITKFQINDTDAVNIDNVYSNSGFSSVQHKNNILK